jgi:hypothetical protein
MKAKVLRKFFAQMEIRDVKTDKDQISELTLSEKNRRCTISQE